jgi:hypothetical protein
VRAGPEFAPDFKAMDKDGNNSVDPDEWAAAEQMTTAFGTWCQSSSASWCAKE